MSMRAVWKDSDGDEIELTEFNDEGEAGLGALFLRPGLSDDSVFAFDTTDARSFAAYLIAWADRTEGR